MWRLSSALARQKLICINDFDADLETRFKGPFRIKRPTKAVSVALQSLKKPIKNTSLKSAEAIPLSLKSRLTRAIYIAAIAVATFGWLWFFLWIVRQLIELVFGSGQQ